MTNVLPRDMRAQLERSTRAKFVFVTSCALSAVALIAILALLPTFVSLYVPRIALEEASRELRETEAQADADRAVVGKTKALLAELEGVREVPVAAPLLQDILAQKPESVRIDSVAYRPGSPGTITLAGSATDRRDLDAYRERLVALERFESVSVPVAALVGALSGAFTITMSGTF